MNKRWTENQKNAIIASNGSVLVSAAAGSGKTAVLVQRIIEKITSKENPVDIDKFLIVTFTNAAASEMRNRIAENLAELCSKEPFNLNLKKQQILLKNASIGTIDGFCNKIVKENFYKLGISQKFRIADENEISLMKDYAFESTLEKYYQESNPQFLALVNLFSNEKNDNKLVSVINKIYEFSRVYPYPQKWFEKILNLFQTETQDPTKTIWGKILLNFAKDSLEEIKITLTEALDLTLEYEIIKKAYFETINNDLKKISSILELFSKGNYEEILNSINLFSFGRLKSLRGENDLKNEILLKRTYAKDIFKKLSKYFCFSSDFFMRDMSEIFNILKILFEVIGNFTDELENQKLLKNSLTFNDLEHMALKILVDENTETPTETACELSKRFEEIMIDEYQDTNELQETIFKAISKNEENVFMVGDVKQSIYRFRQANPKIFISKKERFNFYDPNKSTGSASKIILDKNFRSRSEVLEFINQVFSELMSKDAGEIEYNDEEYLHTGAQYTQTNDVKVEVKLIETDEVSDEAEATNIAETIKNLINTEFKVKDGENERLATFKDFCILLRSYSNHAETYKKKLTELGVPAISESSTKFFDSQEIATIISILRVIDNPVQDIPLIAALMSPAFGFSSDDMAEIRLYEPNVPFYFALKKASENSENLQEFINKIVEYRDLAATTSPNKLVSYIYEDLSFLAIFGAMENGELRQSNLLTFLEYSAKYEGKVFKNLSGFIKFIDKLQSKNADLKISSEILNTQNTVKIMSIHKSKGLEFPVCFLAGCSRKFNTERDDVLIDGDLGIGMRLKDISGTINYNTAIRQAISLKTQKEEISEELRVLYVALTRAKEKLILVISTKNAEETLNKAKIKISEESKLTPFFVLNSTSFTQWLLPCALKFSHPVEIQNFKKNSEIDESKGEISKNTANSTFPINEKILGLINSKFKFKYPNENLRDIPLKTSVSILADGKEWGKHIAASKPYFASEVEISATERGTATHKFLYFCDFKNSFEFELERLENEIFLSHRETEIINKQFLENFFESEICARIKKSKKVLREHRFFINLPINKLYKNNSKDEIIVQGAVDLAFEENGEIVIVDYKTDKTRDASKLFEKYQSQLEVYKMALEKSENIKIKEIIVYSLYLGKFHSKSFDINTKFDNLY